MRVHSLKPFLCLLTTIYSRFRFVYVVVSLEHVHVWASALFRTKIAVGCDAPMDALLVKFSVAELFLRGTILPY